MEGYAESEEEQTQGRNLLAISSSMENQE